MRSFTYGLATVLIAVAIGVGTEARTDTRLSTVQSCPPGETFTEHLNHKTVRLPVEIGRASCRERV